jgi:phosphopantothenoylcysteine synthetase/decarboxylase
MDLFVTDEDEWTAWSRLGDPVLHIDLRNAADLLLVCPASADTMAKISHGTSDSLFLSIVRAWDFRDKPALLCPAMNTVMYESIITQKHEQCLTELGFSIVSPVAKLLACNDVGNGALADVRTIIVAVQERLKSARPSGRQLGTFSSGQVKLKSLKRNNTSPSTVSTRVAFIWGVAAGICLVCGMIACHRRAI